MTFASPSADRSASWSSTRIMLAERPDEPIAAAWTSVDAVCGTSTLPQEAATRATFGSQLERLTPAR